MVKVAPQVDIKFIIPVCGIDGLPVPNHACHDAEDLSVGDAILSPDVMVTANHVVVCTDLEDAVEYILIAALIENSVIALTAGRGVLSTDFDNIAALAQKRHHAHAYVGIN